LMAYFKSHQHGVEQAASEKPRLNSARQYANRRAMAELATAGVNDRALAAGYSQPDPFLERLSAFLPKVEWFFCFTTIFGFFLFSRGKAATPAQLLFRVGLIAFGVIGALMTTVLRFVLKRRLR
jgi:hypothetical protein